MMGLGYHLSERGGGGGGSSSCYSDLSASAPPFTVDRSLPKPVLTEPLNTSSSQNWINHNSIPEFGSPFDSCCDYSCFLASQQQQNINAYGSADGFSCAQKSDGVDMSFVKAEPYYPTYLSLGIPHGYDLLPGSDIAAFEGSCSENAYGPSFSGCGTSAGWVGSFVPNDVGLTAAPLYRDYLGIEARASKEQSRPEGTSLGIDLLASRATVDNSSSARKTNARPSDSLSAEYSKAGSSSTFQEGNYLEPFAKLVRSRSHEAPYDAICENSMKQHSAVNPDGIPSCKCDFGPLMKSPSPDTYSSPQSTGLLRNVDDVPERNSLIYNSDAMTSVDPCNFTTHSHGNERNFANNTAQSKRSACDDIYDHFFGGKLNIQGSHTGLNNFGLSPDTDEAFNNSCEASDYYNPVIDSPCWKGASVSRSSIETSKSDQHNIEKLEEAYNGSNFQQTRLFPWFDASLRNYCQNPSEDSGIHENRCLNDNIAPFPKIPSANTFLSRALPALERASNRSKANYSHEAQYFDDVDEPRKEAVVSNKSINESDSESFVVFERSSKEEKSIFENKLKGEAGVIATDAPDSDSFWGPQFHNMRDPVQFSRETIPAKLTESLGDETPTVNILVLLNSLNGLSKLLRAQCSNGTCTLKDQENEILKNVIEDLSSCAVEKAGPVTPKGEEFLQRVTSQPFKLDESHSSSSSEGVKEVSDVPCQSDNQHILQENDDPIMSINTESVKDEKMTQAIKKILDGNFDNEEEIEPQALLYKNLWLEAEAALCSITYKARFSQMKIKMDNCKSPVEKALCSDSPEKSIDAKSESISNLSSDPTSAGKPESAVNGIRTPAFSLQDLQIAGRISDDVDDVIGHLYFPKSPNEASNSVNAVDVENLTSLDVPSDANNIGQSEPTITINYFPDLLNDHFGIVGEQSNVSDDVMARFRILKCRVDEQTFENGEDTENLSCSEVSTDADKTDAEDLSRFQVSTDKIDLDWSPGEKGVLSPKPSNSGSIFSSMWSHFSDNESSVVARLNILKSRENNLSSIDVPPEIIMTEMSEADTPSSDGINYINELSVKEFYMHVKDDPVVPFGNGRTPNNVYGDQPGYQSSANNVYGDQLGYQSSANNVYADQLGYQSSSSDWEHVLNDDLEEHSG